MTRNEARVISAAMHWHDREPVSEKELLRILDEICEDLADERKLEGLENGTHVQCDCPNCYTMGPR